MKRKNILIVAVLIFCMISVIVFKMAYINPLLDKERVYATGQNSAITHDISVLQDYKSCHLGDAVRIAKIYDNLPLYAVRKTYEINAKEYKITVNYFATPDSIEIDDLRTAMAYNAIVSFALVEDIKTVQFNFTGSTYSFEREKMKKIVGTDHLQELINDPQTWENHVQKKLNDEEYVKLFYSQGESST